jgi:hypothetical protein
MQVVIALRGGENTTDHRPLAFAAGLECLFGVSVKKIGRSERLPGKCDLFVQTAFGASTPLRDAIDRRIPYMIMEAPSFRHFWLEDGREEASTFTFNGVQAGGSRPRDIPDEERPHPPLLENHGEGTIILAQKPNDHSLRESDHVAWLKEKFIEYPEAELRHNPIMVPEGYNKPLADHLAERARTVAYTSTASVDSLLAGLITICDHPANEAYEVTDREEWVHRLSWYNFTHEEWATAKIASWVMTGLVEASEDAKAGRVERPREKVCRGAGMAEYYAEFPYDGYPV